jgi:hypothetical protein
MRKFFFLIPNTQTKIGFVYHLCLAGDVNQHILLERIILGKYCLVKFNVMILQKEVVKSWQTNV